MKQVILGWLFILAAWLTPNTSVVAQDAQNVRVVGSFDLPVGYLVGMNGETLVMRTGDSVSTTVITYNLTNPLAPDSVSKFSYRFRQSDFYDDALVSPSVSMAKRNRFVFSTYEWGHVQQMTIGYTWKIETVNDRGQVLSDWSDSETRMVGSDMLGPYDPFSFDDYTVFCGGEFESPIFYYATNRVQSMGYIGNLSSISFENDTLITAINPSMYTREHVIKFLNFSDPYRLSIVSQFVDHDFNISRIVRNGNVLFETVYNDTSQFTRWLDISDVHNIRVGGQFALDFPQPVCMASGYLVCIRVSEPMALVFYDVTNLNEPRIVASCTGLGFSPVVRADGSLFTYDYRQRRVFLLDQIGLSVPNEPDVSVSGFTFSAYPNPFNAQVTFDFSNLSAGGGFLRIYDQSGRVFSENQVHGASGSWIWDAASAPAGQYFVEVHSSGTVMTKPVTLLK